MRWLLSSRAMAAICGALVLLLAALAVVQYRWSTRVSAADAQRRIRGDWGRAADRRPGDHGEEGEKARGSVNLPATKALPIPERRSVRTIVSSTSSTRTGSWPRSKPRPGCWAN